MRVIVVGLGVQGRKRATVAGPDVVATVDPVVAGATCRHLEELRPHSYDAALVCVPDSVKADLVCSLLRQGKHVLVEKPLLIGYEKFLEAEQLAGQTGAVCYTAYNHRFEPHFVKMRDLIGSGDLGKLYRCRMFYGNGTARDVRDSPWRDKGTGVLPDLGSHLLDTVLFWFGNLDQAWRVVTANRYENRALDHMVVVGEGDPDLELEMSLLSWRNHFQCDLIGEYGSAHILSLCKWGPSTFIRRWRTMPSGRPTEEATTLVKADPTWATEYEHFKKLCDQGTNDLTASRLIEQRLAALAASLPNEATA